MNIAPRPYVSQGYRTEQESEEQQTQDSLSRDDRQPGQNGGGQNEPKTIARGRAPMTANGSKKPFPGKPMSARASKPVPMGTSRPMSRAVGNQSIPQAAPRMPQPAPQIRQNIPMVSQQPMAPVQPRPVQQPVQPVAQPVQQPVQQNAMAPVQDVKAQEQINNMARNNRVNIAQIIKDFRGTYAAIGTPQCLVDEVEDYLAKVVEHTKGDAPSINFVQTNLQNAAVIIDKYISETLEKESKVVQNWLDALFLQRINYSYNDGEINQDFLVKFPEGGNAPQQPDSVVTGQPEPAQEVIPEQNKGYETIPDYQPQQVQQPVNQTVPIQHAQAPQPMVAQAPLTAHNSQEAQRVIRRAPQPVRQQVVTPVAPVKRKPQITIIPEDNELKALFVQAKKQAYSNNPAKAMNIFQKALIRAEAINDSETQSKICYEMGKIYDDNNYLVQALSNYNKSLQDTTDVDIKTKAHYSMAKIYDDVNQVDSAINHYMTSVSYAGQDDNLSSQSKSLTNIANIYTDRYDLDAFIFYDEANVLVEQTDDSEMKGYVSSNTAGAFNKFNKPDKALKCYANAVRNYSDARVDNSVAENYYAAGELMYDLKNPAKAKILLKKALVHTDTYRDANLINKINDLLEEIG